MKTFYLMMIVITLPACATPVERSMDVMDGLHISAAVKHFGAPDDKQIRLGNSIYNWRYENQDDDKSCVITAETNAGDMIRKISYVEDNDGCETYLIQTQDILNTYDD